MTTFVLVESIKILARPSDDSGTVNVAILFGFSSANAAIDILSLILFWMRGPGVVLHEHEHVPSAMEGPPLRPGAEIQSVDPQFIKGPHQCRGIAECCIAEGCTHMSIIVLKDNDDGEDCASEADVIPEIVEFTNPPNTPRTRNTNMMSALTHLSGDTLRTLAVFTAALVATFAGQPSSKCDAVASLVVSFSIFGILIPLIREISKHILLVLDETSTNVWKIRTVTDNIQYRHSS